MATTKQPKQSRFPHPPLEVGVAKYPTPLVPNYNDKKGGWGLNDQGHIILQEKVSIEKGSFNPQPLDGSVTYTGRDANKWPSTLYLVAETPSDDGQYIYRFWANDRSLASQDKWNYGISYPDQNPDYPSFTRIYITPRSTYTPVAIGSTDPVFGGTAIVTSQEMSELPDDNPLRSRYVAVKRTYETIPGALVSGYQYDDQFETNLTISKQIIPAGSEQLEHTNGILSYKDEPVDSTKSQRVIVSTPGLPPTRTEYYTGTYTSPLLVFGIATQAGNFSCTDIDVRVKLTPNTRASQNRTTTFKTIKSYSYGPPSPSGDTDLFSPELKSIAYTGYVINFNLGGGLCDTLNSSFDYKYFDGTNIVTITVATIPVLYCDGHVVATEQWSIPATTITATEYLNAIGTYKKISWESKYWKAGIWESREVWVKLV